MPKRVTLTLSDDLHAAADILRQRRRYRSFSEYVQGLIRYDGQSQRDHILTAEWAAFSPAERDMLDAAILRQVESGEGIRGSWLEARIEAAIAACLAKGETPTPGQIAADLATP